MRSYKKRQHKDGTWINAKAEKDYNNLLSLHEEQIESFGVDNLSTAEAYTKVLGHKSGYLRGMGAGPPPLKRVNNNGEYSSQSIMTESEFQDRLKVELEVYTKQKDAEFQQTVIALKNQFKNDMNDEIRKLKEELTSSIPQKMCSNTTSVAHQNDANKHINASSICQSKSGKVGSIAQTKKTVGGKAVNRVPKSHKDVNDKCTSKQNDEATGKVCIVCQLTLANMDAYLNHLNGIKHMGR
ncbi:hypothetical protein M5689_010990 [Euphorbia peplus]|nr:hypothetical protein M5689_010990 [Euphorbia peplus]